MAHRLIGLSVLTLLAWWNVPAAAAEVTLTKGERTVKATIGDEAFLVFQFDPERKKPFILPITGPKGMSLLKAELEKPEAERTPDADRVLVVQEQAEVRDGETVSGRADFGTVLTAVEVQDGRVRVREHAGWLRAADVAPLVAIVTRLIDDQPVKGVDRLDPRYYDHPHHKGIWFAVDEVNEIKYWNENGRIRNVSVDIVEARGNPAVLRVENHWVDGKDRVVLKESTTIRISADRLIDYAATLSPGEEAVTFGDTKEGLFAIRLPNSMREFAGGGPVINADGLEGTAACWGKASPWVDYQGPIHGTVFGVTVMDHPSNFRPSRYHVRDYGLFAINPFGEASYTNGESTSAPVTLEPGKSLTLRYGAWVHGGDAGREQIQKRYEQFSGN